MQERRSRAEMLLQPTPQNEAGLSMSATPDASKPQTKTQALVQTKNKKYQCPCGSTMSRRWVIRNGSRLYEYLCELTCQKAQDKLKYSDSGTITKKSSRSKTACNRCASSRLKCDSQHPCQRCIDKSVNCQYTRKGYSDPYDMFLIKTGDEIPANTTHDDTSRIERAQYTNNSDPSSSNFVAVNMDADIFDFNILEPSFSSQNSNSMLINGFDSIDAVNPFQDIDWDSLLVFPNWTTTTTTEELVSQTPLPLAPVELNAISEQEQPSSTGLQLQQIDSVEAKCVDIRGYLTSSKTGIDPTAISKYTTRDCLVDSIRTYAQTYQSIQPIIHMPTFDLTKTSPELLLAMMLVGACYSDSDTTIPPAIVIQGAIHVLLLIESASHERAMGVPPLASIQANTLLCQILILTKNKEAFHFAMLHRARTISMAERAGIFSVSDSLTYRGMHDNSFDWHTWSHLEMRRRLAHHIFIDDIGNAIFSRGLSHMSPFTIYTAMPSYNDSWTAQTAKDCLEKLQNAPPPIQMPTALNMLRSVFSPTVTNIFDASDRGMLQVIIALHYMLFQMMQESLDFENVVPKDHGVASSEEIRRNLVDLVGGNGAVYNIAEVANDLVMKYGFDGIKRINQALDAWKRNWDNRQRHDVHGENHTAFSHPINFWMLAKLFIVLHFFRNQYINTDSTELFDSSHDKGLHLFYTMDRSKTDSRLAIQGYIIGWLSLIRRQKGDRQLTTGSFLSQVLTT